MSVQISQRQVGNVTILDLSGRITLGKGVESLREAIRGLLASERKQILLNMSDVTYVDGAGIGELVSGYTSTSNYGGQLKLLGLQKKVHDFLQITTLYTVFDIHTNEQAALASFQAAKVT